MQRVLEHSQATGLDRTVLLLVAFYAARDTDLAWPSNAELCRSGLSERRIQMGLRTAERLGELRRRPDLESGERPRVYHVDPQFRSQLSLLGSAGGVHVVHPAPGAPAQMSVRPAPRARVEGTDVNRHNGLTPPAPPQAGGDEEPASSGSFRQSPTPRRQGVAAARRERRRRARRGLTRPPEPCPLDSAATDMAVLQDAWLALNAGLRERLDAHWWELWTLWSAGAHAHRADSVLEVGVYATAWSGFTVLSRTVEELAERRVVFVTCDAVAAAAR